MFKNLCSTNIFDTGTMVTLNNKSSYITQMLAIKLPLLQTP